MICLHLSLLVLVKQNPFYYQLKSDYILELNGLFGDILYQQALVDPDNRI